MVNDLIELLENHQVTQRLCGGVVPPPTPGDDWGCFTCGQKAHLARHCPGVGDVSMPTASQSDRRGGACHRTACWTWRRPHRRWDRHTYMAAPPPSFRTDTDKDNSQERLGRMREGVPPPHRVLQLPPGRGGTHRLGRTVRIRPAGRRRPEEPLGTRAGTRGAIQRQPVSRRQYPHFSTRVVI